MRFFISINTYVKYDEDCIPRGVLMYFLLDFALVESERIFAAQ